MTEEKKKAPKPRTISDTEEPGQAPGFDKPLFTGAWEGHVLHDSVDAN
jgi:hypothetical protein